MLSEMLAIGGNQTANVLALVSKMLEQRPGNCVKISEVDQGLWKARTGGMSRKEIPAIDLSPTDVIAYECLLDASCFHEFLCLVNHCPRPLELSSRLRGRRLVSG